VKASTTDATDLMRWRIALLVVLLALLQVTVFTHLRVFGVVPDVGLVLAVAVAYRFGPEAGAITGFAAGLAYDLFLETPFGLSALAYALAAYWVGILHAGMMRSPRGIPIVLGAWAGLVGGALFIGIGGLVGVEGMWTTRAVVVVLIAAVYDAVIALFVFFLVKRISASEASAPGAWVR
jgi:rod shape-determining protein MreD